MATALSADRNRPTSQNRLTRAVEDLPDPSRKVFRRQAAVPFAERFGFVERLERFVFVAVVGFEGVLRILGGAEEGPDVAVVRQVLSEAAKFLCGVLEFAAEVAFQSVANALRRIREDDGAGLRGTRGNDRRLWRGSAGCGCEIGDRGGVLRGG